MNQWWYADNGVQRGPFGTDTLRRFVLDGLINGATLFWREGMAGWTAMEAIPELASLLPSRAVPAAADNIPLQPQAGAPQPARQPAVTREPGAALYGAAPKRGMGTGMKIFLGLVGCAIVLGIVVAALAFSNAEFRKGFVSGLEAHRQERTRQVREMQGEAAQAPQEAGAHTWPADMPPPNVPVDRPDTGAQRADTSAGGSNAAGGDHTWTNPATGLSMTLDPAWSGTQTSAASSGTVFIYDFSDNTSNLGFRVIAEHLPSGFSLEDLAANFRRQNGGAYQFFGAEQYSLISGHRVWEIDARSIKIQGALVHAQVAVTSQYCWTVISSRGETDAAGENRLEALRAQFWDTVQ